MPAMLSHYVDPTSQLYVLYFHQGRGNETAIASLETAESDKTMYRSHIVLWS